MLIDKITNMVNSFNRREFLKLTSTGTVIAIIGCNVLSSSSLSCSYDTSSSLDSGTITDCSQSIGWAEDGYYPVTFSHCSG